MTEIERFETKYIPIPESGCWIWVAGSISSGYGMFWMDGKQVRAHRAAYMLYRGKIEDGMLVRHKCDVKECVNPNHMDIGTHAENMIDMVMRGRSASGSLHGNAKLTDDEIFEIKHLYDSHRLTSRSIGRMYGISKTHVLRISKNKGRISQC